MTKLERAIAVAQGFETRCNKLEGENANLRVRLALEEKNAEHWKQEVRRLELDFMPVVGRLAMLQSVFDRFMRKLDIDDMVSKP